MSFFLEVADEEGFCGGEGGGFIDWERGEFGFVGRGRNPGRNRRHSGIGFTLFFWALN